MRTKNIKAMMKASVLIVGAFLAGAIGAYGQQKINLSAGPVNTIMPDGTTVPMWGYTCGAAVTGSTATCAALNPLAPIASPAPLWSPVIITVPSGQDLEIDLTNSLTVPTSLVIVGQVGGGLGATPVRTPSPAHPAQSTTWPAVDPTTTNTPPTQGDRVRSFATEVPANSGTATPLCWGVCSTTNPQPALRPGTYLLESGSHPSIQGPMGLYGILVVTTAPSASTGLANNAGCAYGFTAASTTTSVACNVTYNAEVPLLLSEIDPVQNKAVDTAVKTAGFSETMVWSGQAGGCADPASTSYHQCYPPAVNYSPLYYLINGSSFDKTNSSVSNFPTAPAGTTAAPLTGTVLVRLVNAGLRMHVPSIVGAQTGPAAAPASGFGLIAEDGNPLPGLTRVQSEVFMAAGKTYDVMVNVVNTPAAAGTSLPVFDRQGSLSGNATSRETGMLAYINMNGAALPKAGSLAAATVSNIAYPGLLAGQSFAVSDPAKGVVSVDTNVYGVQLLTPASGGTVALNANGTFTYTPTTNTTAASDSFTYCANGSVTGTVCSSGLVAKVSLTAASLEGAAGIHLGPKTYTSSLAGSLHIKPSGVLSETWSGVCTPTPAAPCHDYDAAGYPLTIVTTGTNAPVPSAGLTLTMDPNGDGGFTASVTGPGTYSFTYQAQNSQGTVSTAAATVTLVFPMGSGLTVSLVDGQSKVALSPQDYRWIIEEDRTFYVDPNCQVNPLPAGCPTVTSQGTPAIFGTNFHASWMPVVAQGCTGPESCESQQTVLGVSSVCDVGNGACRPGAQKTATLPGDAVLDPTKRYYISVLPGDMADASPGHDMGGAELVFVNGAWHSALAPTTAGVQILVEPEMQIPAKVSAFVFEDDHPLNGEHDGGGGVDTLSPNEPGLGGFNITILDLAGQSGDAVGQMTYDQFNQPLSNALAGSIDPTTGKDACPISKDARTGIDTGSGSNLPAPSDVGITGVIPVCPQYEADGKTLSPLGGQAIVVNLPPGRYGIVATPAADRIARGEEWLQTNTLDGGKDHEAFIRTNGPAYFQEFGPASYHVSIGFANPKWINDQGYALCHGPGAPACTQTVQGHVTGVRMSRPSDERLYGSGSRDEFGYTQCFVSLGSPDGADISFNKCDADGNFTLANIPEGDYKVTIFDQWNDQIVDGISTPVRVGAGTNTTLNPLTNLPLCPGAASSTNVCDMGEIGVHGWKNNLYTRSFLDMNGNGVADHDLTGTQCVSPGVPTGCNANFGNDTEQGLALVSTNIRYRDGSFSNFNSTDLNGYAGFNEVFPIFNWYTVETSSTRFKNTGVHVVNDAGGPADSSDPCGVNGFPACGNSSLLPNLANTTEKFSLPADLRIPGSVYCLASDCTGANIVTGVGNAPVSCTTDANGHQICSGVSTGRIDPPTASSYGWQSFMGQNQYLEFGKKPFATGENGGIQGHVVYASTRPFDDPQLLLQNSWEPLVPHVTINLYQEGTAADGITQTLKLVDTTTTTSWDDWMQGFRSNGIPNISCPGQDPSDPFLYTLQNQPLLLNLYNAQHPSFGTFNPAATGTQVPYNSQFKCYDGMHNWNQLQPAPYDGMYSFPSVTSFSLTTGKPNGTNCTICMPNPAPSTDWSSGLPMLPSGKYVVEVVLPPGYELVKEEDKNLLNGDVYTAPVTQQFAGFGNIFIMPDQASIAAYNPSNAQIPTTDLGVSPRHEGDTGSVEEFWPCVGAKRVVPDWLSINPALGLSTPFAGATRPLCDRKEVALNEQTSALVKFYVFTSAHIAAHMTGIISDDFTSEFDPFSPAFGEKFSPPNLPVSIKDRAGNEVSRLWSDNHGIYNGLTYSSWTVNPPDPSGYTPQMFIMCMNDRGSDASPDRFYQPAYSQFCYEWSFMPGQTGYLDTPVIPTAAFAANYNHPDCAYPNGTPAIGEVDGNGVGPYVPSAGSTLTIHTINQVGTQCGATTIANIGDACVNNYAYSGPSVTASPYNQKTIIRHYGFGSTAGTVGLVGSDNVFRPLTGVIGWSDTTITGNVPGGVPACTGPQQKAAYGGSSANCGELVIKAANGKQSVDTVTVTIGGKTPTRLTAGQSIQSAINAAKPGDLIIVPPGTYHEMVLMWKPVRLQGVGAASSIIDANTHPSGTLLNDWRRDVDCLFGIAPTGVPTNYSASCGAGWMNFSPTPNDPQVDRLPLEAMVGWDATLNGNLAEQLQEPSLMGAYEGAGITVVGKGVHVPSGTDPWTDGTEASAYPANASLILSNNCSSFPSSFACNPSRIDGLSVTNSSQGGGGIFVHGWAHNLEISNNRVYNNQGTLAGGITVGQGEHPGVYTQGGTNSAPGPCQPGFPSGVELPYCFNTNVNVHNNAVTMNSSEGDELFSATASGSGGVVICSGADFYKFNYNWVCGNLSTGDGAGVTHLGFIYNGDIEHNQILFNQATNPTTPSNGGGLLIMAGPDTDPTCPGEPDTDCSHAYGTVGDGVGPGLKINANLILGNAAEAGSGGGIRFQGVNGVEVSTFPTQPTLWHNVDVTNNIIVNNVAGWDGAGVSLQDSIKVNLINNTIASNDSTASSGTLFGSFFSTQASSPTPCPRDGIGANLRCVPLSNPQPAGVSASEHSAEFEASLPLTINCPAGHPLGGSALTAVTNGACRKVSWPVLYNNVLWQNRAFHIDIVQPAANSGQQQATVTLVPKINQAATGSCSDSAGTGTALYWDLGLRGDTGPTDHSSGFTFQPKASVMTSTTGYPAGPAGLAGNITASSSSVLLVRQYCNGSKIPPEAGLGAWYQTPPGTNENNVPTPVFNLTAGATVDEGNNWVNISWGPMSLVTPSTEASPATETILGDYSLPAGSPAINYITSVGSSVSYVAAPNTDFFGNGRKGNLGSDALVDAGAVEFNGGGAAVTSASVTPSPLAFGNWATGTTSNPLLLTVTNTGTVALAGGTFTIAGGLPYSRVTTGTFPAGAPNCAATLAVGASCTIKVQFAPTTTGLFSRSLTVAYTGATVTPTPVSLTGTGVATRGTVSISPNPLTITLPSGTLTGSGNVTLTNTTAAGGSSVAVTNVTVSGFGLIWAFTKGTDNCTGVNLAPGATCTVQAQFSRIGSVGTHTGAISFTDSATGSPQAGVLSGVAQ
jgi:hypothetical protein